MNLPFLTIVILLGRGCGRDIWDFFRTGTAEDAGDLHELDGLLRGIHFD